MLAILYLMVTTVAANGIDGSYYLEGIGYREQELQVAKSTRFRSEEANGVAWASFAGYTNIFVKGAGLVDNPQKNFIVFESHDFNFKVTGPMLTEDDSFNSQPLLGNVAYRIPPVNDLFGQPMEFLDQYQTLTFTISVMAAHDLLEEPAELTCSNPANCRLVYRRTYTPTLYYLSPRVVYNSAYADLWFDPRSTPNLITGLEQERMLFINARVSKALMDFEDFVDHTTRFSNWAKNRVRGQVGELPIADNHTISMQWETGKARVLDHYATTCDIFNKTCYQAKTVPVIFDISDNVGYSSGGQNLTVTGHGFTAGNITATVDGVNCVITQSQDDSFSCEIQPKANISQAGLYPGSHGLRRSFYKTPRSFMSNWARFDTEEHTDSLSMETEIPYSLSSNWHANRLQGYFVPPVTTRYRFYMSCDDWCRFDLDIGNNGTMIKVLETRGWTHYRDYWDFQYVQYRQTISQWVSLTAGQRYRLDTKQAEGTGGDHLTLSVEVEKTAEIPEGHHQAMKEIQYVEVKANGPFETSTLTIDGVDDGQYKLILFANNGTPTATGKISAKATAAELQDSLQTWFEGNAKSKINVTRIIYDANGTDLLGNETAQDNVTNATLWTKSVYNITLRKYISGKSNNNMRILNQGSSASLHINASWLESGQPLSGNMRFHCINPAGYSSFSQDVSYNAHENTVKYAIMRGCTKMNEKIDVWTARNTGYEYRENGVGFYIRYSGKGKDMGQMSIESSNVTLLSGDNITFNQNTTIPYGGNPFYEPIPFEWLRTHETKPQLIVSVNGEPAVCHNMTCDYNYTIPVGEVTGFTYTAATKQLVITGIDLPPTIGNVSKVMFAKSPCIVSAADNTSLTCTLVHTETCGSHVPYIYSTMGLVNNSASLQTHTVTCNMASVHPTTQLNLLGYDNLTFTGDNLPWFMNTSTVEIKFNDASQTPCIPQWDMSTTTKMVCLTQPFNAETDAGTTLGLNITINGQTVIQSLSLSLMSDKKSGVVLVPNSASPVLKTKVNITLEASFPYSLVKEDFTVNATNITNPTYFRPLNVIAVDDTTKTLTALFGGAWSGLYKISIRHRQFGLIDNVGLIFTVGSNVTDVSPNTGSRYGGSLITITGNNFGTVPTDNPVQMSTNGGVGSINCFVKTINETQITCRIGETNQTDGKKAEAVTFLKLSEEAKCVPDSVCDWEYKTPSATLSTVDSAYNTADGEWQVTITGTGFNGTCAETEFTVYGRKQTCKSLSSTEAVFTIDNLLNTTIGGMKLYFAEGSPTGYKSVLNSTLTITPKFKAVSPNVGAAGGTLLKVSAPGVGPNSNVTLGFANGTKVCNVTINNATNEFYCLTHQFNESSQMAVIETVGGSETTHSCVAADQASCQFNQTYTGYPLVTSVAHAAGTLTFTGTDLLATGYNVSAKLSGVSSTSVTVAADGLSAVATFDRGVPVTSSPQVPRLIFTNQVNSTEFHASITNITVDNPILVTAASASLECSFAGGCKYEVHAQGLSALMKQNNKDHFIKVCDEKCVYDDASSDASIAKCTLPKVSTLHSDASFNISEMSEDLRTGKPFGTLKNISVPFDNVLVVRPEEDAQIGGQCFVGLGFKAGHVAMMRQVKWFMGNIQDKTLYENELKFQGSNDNSTWTDLFTVDESVHEGWNYHAWEDPADYPKYRFYKFSGTKTGSCLINEIKITGVETIDISDTDSSCQAVLVSGGTEQDLQFGSITYKSDKTTLLTGVSPRYGTVTGGTDVTFSGQNFVTDISLYTIMLDGFVCPVKSANTTSVTCTTAKRPGLHNSTTTIYIEGRGYVATQGIIFTYVSLWSHETTWGGEFAPMHMESVYVPSGFNLLVDVDKTPQLNAVIVMGSLIFQPDADENHERFFDARYIYVDKGRLEVGTEQFPYTSKLTITMHGDQYSPYLPIYGNKVIGIRESTLDLHGVKREPTWTLLETTVQKGATQITLAEPVDWKAGEQIAIASTEFDGRLADQRTIVSVDRSDPSKPVLTLDLPLDYRHIASFKSYNGTKIDMRAEVGLLTRNVKFRGDPETSKRNEYGANIFLHSHGDDSLIGRIENIEMTDVGQGFKIGRYAVHFHMIGAVHKSYARGNAVHNGFNRAFTLHGTNYMRLENNVGYSIKGHNIFIEDGVEKKNRMYRNCLIKVKRSYSGLNTDTTPAGFWITTPDNAFIENRVGGSDRYAYWYDLQIHAIGPHANTAICPENERVGEFRDNHAHSCGRYGLRLFHNMVPRKYPCKPIVYDSDYLSKGEDSPWWQNPPITANFNGFTGWKNLRNGAIAKTVGDIRFNDFKTADNLLAGIEFAETDTFGDKTTEMAQINRAVIVGRSYENDELKLEKGTPRGIITPRTDNFVIQGVRFFNFNWGDAAALGSCSHCYHDQASDSGARTIVFRNNSLDATVTRVCNFMTPWRAIFFDEDGTMTGKGPGSWMTPYYPSHNVTGCESNINHTTTMCDSSVQIRRIAFYAAMPANIFAGMAMKILPYNDDLFLENGGVLNRTLHEQNKTAHGSFFYKQVQNPSNGWALPMVTNNKYKISWGMTGVEWESITMTRSENWNVTDHSLYLVHNWTDVRQKIQVRDCSYGQSCLEIENNTIPTSENDYKFGQNVIWNETAIRETHFIVNGKDSPVRNRSTSTLLKRSILSHEAMLKFQGYRCWPEDACLEKVDFNKTPEGAVRYWSDKNNWPNKTLPVTGDDVHIEAGWNMVYDMNYTMQGNDTPPIFQLVRVNGNLSIADDGKDKEFRCKHLFIRNGEFHVGSKEKPYQGNFTLALFGEKNAETIVYTNAVEAGNKNVANLNKLYMYGRPRLNKMSRLTKELEKGATSLFVEPGLDWVPGDRIAVFPTSFQPHAQDDLIWITSYDNVTGEVKLNNTIEYYHFGRANSTGDLYNGVDIRAEVVLLTRNVKIVGEDIESWGGQIVTGFALDQDIFRYGQTYMDNIEIFNCSQIDTEKAALRWEDNIMGHSSVTNSVIHHGMSWGVNVKNSQNIIFSNNIVYGFRPIGIQFQSFPHNITFNDNVIGHVVERTTFESDGTLMDKEGCVAICADSASDKCTGFEMQRNIAGGCAFAGFLTQGHRCGEADTQTRFRDNVAHSSKGTASGDGLMLEQDKSDATQAQCYEVSHFSGYKNWFTGLITFSPSFDVRVSQVNIVDNRMGVIANTVPPRTREYETHTSTIQDSHIYGNSISPDCPQDGNGGFCIKEDKYGYTVGMSTRGGKSQFITHSSPRPAVNNMADSTWGGQNKILRNKFFDYVKETSTGNKNHMFGLNFNCPDFVPITMFEDNEFKNIDGEAFGYFRDPTPGWANVKDCGNFPCTGPWNVLLTFKRTSWSGRTPSYAKSTFQLIADNPGFAPYVPDCSKLEENNMWMCEQSKLSMLMFESEDADNRDRGMQPVYVQMQEPNTKKNDTDPGMNSKLNSFMDHVWDGFYSGQVRESRFPAIVWAPKGSIYNLTFSGSPAKKFLFELKSLDSKAGMTVRIAYPSAESRKIIKNGAVVEMNQWDESLYPPQYGEIKQKFCGENRYIGVKNILEFYITAGCKLRIAPRNAIQTMVRMEHTMDSFFNNGGTTSFMDRIASSLGIHASTIKIVSVYEGSLVVNYAIENDNPQELAAVQQKQTDAFATGTMDVGAPILDVQAYATSDQAESSSSSSSASSAPVSIISGGVVSAPGYEPITITAGAATTTRREKSVFIPKDLSITVKNQITKQYIEKEVQQSVTQTVVAPAPKVETNANSALIVVAVGVSIIVLVVLVYCLRSLYIKANFESIQKAAIEAKTRAITVGGNQVEDAKNEGNNNYEGSTNKKMKDAEFDNLEEQYNPHHDFAIFGVGNKKGGGLQTLQEKMNAADDVEGSSDEDENEKNQDKVAADYASVAKDSIDVSIDAGSPGMPSGRPSSSGVSSDEPLYKKESQPSDQYVLPEDDEIVEVTEEEEEEE